MPPRSMIEATALQLKGKHKQGINALSSVPLHISDVEHAQV